MYDNSGAYWCAELLRWGFRGYGTGDIVVVLWYWRSGHVREVDTFQCGKVSYQVLRDTLNEKGWDMLAKGSMPKAKSPEATKVVDPGFLKKYPTLFDHLTQVVWDDGTVRQPSTLLVFVADGFYKGLLKDREAEMTLWGAAATFDGLLGVLEKAAGDPDAEWRAERQPGGSTPAARQKKR